MKKLETLKTDLLQDKVENFYVFYGEDYGIRRHYIERLKTYFQKISYMDNCDSVSKVIVAKSLFNLKELIIIYDDQEFPKLTREQIQTFINRLKDKTILLIYEEPLTNTTLFKDFDKYITYFPVVQDNIAKEFVDSELKLSLEYREQFGYNCLNNYNNILLEADKVKNYAQSTGISEQNSYESLLNKKQVLEQLEDYDSGQMMNDVLVGDYRRLSYWINIVKTKDVDRFQYTLMFIFYDYLIAYLIKKYGKYEGSSRAYRYGLPWGRAKVIRELDINSFQSEEQLLNAAYSISQLDVDLKQGKISKENLIDIFIGIIV